MLFKYWTGRCTRNFSNTRVGFPSQRFLATPTFLIPLAPPSSPYLCGPSAQIPEIARGCGVIYSSDGTGESVFRAVRAQHAGNFSVGKKQFKAFWSSGPKAPDEGDWIKPCSSNASARCRALEIASMSAQFVLGAGSTSSGSIFIPVQKTFELGKRAFEIGVFFERVEEWIALEPCHPGQDRFDVINRWVERRFQFRPLHRRRNRRALQWPHRERRGDSLAVTEL